HERVRGREREEIAGLRLVAGLVRHRPSAAGAAGRALQLGGERGVADLVPGVGNLEVRIGAGVGHIGKLRRCASGEGHPEEYRATPDDALNDAVGLARQEVRPPRRDYVVSSMTPSPAMVQVCRAADETRCWSLAVRALTFS